MAICEYSPQITTGNPDFTPPPATLDEIVRRSTILFTKDALEVELPAPQLGDSDRLDYDRIFRHTRGLSIRVFRELFWQKRNVLELHFAALTEEQLENLFYFLKTTLGKQIIYTDYNSWEWEGIIVNPFNQAEDIRGNSCYYNFSLNFRGVRI